MARILIVDDWNIEFMFKRTLESIREQGHIIKNVHDAHEALGKIQTNKYDIAIIDLSEDVKVRGNYTLSELIQEEYPSTILVSWSAQASRYSSINSAFRYHIVKEVEDFKHMLQEIIEKECL